MSRNAVRHAVARARLSKWKATGYQSGFPDLTRKTRTDLAETRKDRFDTISK